MSNSVDPIGPDRTTGHVWVETVCKGNQQTALEGKKLLHVKATILSCTGSLLARINLQMQLHKNNTCMSIVIRK